MNRYLFMTILTAGTGLAFLSCSNDDDQQVQAVQREIRLGTDLGGVTRSNEATNLLSGDTVYVWADMVNATDGEQTEYFKAWSLTADGVGGLTPMSDTKLFPATNNLNFYALVGNFGKDSNDNPVINPEIAEETDRMALPATGIRHTVLSDQRESEDYYKSDLLYAVVKNQSPVSQAVVLPFQHLLSRIQVVLVAGNGMTADDLSTATVKLLNLKRQVTFRPDSTKDVTIYPDDAVKNAASRANLSGMLTIPVGAQQSDILMATEAVARLSDVAATTYADAIVVPTQTITAGTNFIEVDYLDRQTYYKLPADFTIASGKQYRFRLVCDRIGETYELNTVTVEDWGAAGTALPAWFDTLVQ